MQRLRHAAIALLAVVVLGIAPARGASTTNFTDQWWIPAESGWGAAVLQQWDTLFIDLFVYGADGKPTWFVCAAQFSGSPGGHAVFTGDVYTASGPYYGGPFNAAPVVGRKVGTLTFDADTITTATLTYTVDGTPVTKNVTRQTWSGQSLSGSYYGGSSGTQSQCGTDNGPVEDQQFIDIVHVGNSLTLKLTDLDGQVITIAGNYTQSGHMGAVDGTVTTLDFSGTASVYEIEPSIAGITGRATIVLTSGGNPVCVWNGRWGGVRR